MSTYLCYDIKGIQPYIFKIPQLRYIIGGSAIIDNFDRTIIPKLAESEHGIKLVSSAGGKGGFQCADDAAANRIEKRIVAEGRTFGLEIRIGRGERFIDAAKNADKTYSFVPDSLDGTPCPTSGLYPTKGKEHEVVKIRENKFSRYFEEKLGDKLRQAQVELGSGTHYTIGEKFTFFNDPDAQRELLGNRNRWAIICMDGNDIGKQYHAKAADSEDGDIDFDWLKKMSAALDDCTEKATLAGILAVVQKWREDGGEGDILPIRPLVVGGDDITVICHFAYAFNFVKKVMCVFSNPSNNMPGHQQLWPATNGRLTISAGILFAPVTYPLHTAIPYTEALLANAKAKFRTKSEGGKIPSPESLDWESVTEGLIDTPTARRKRELRFFDKSCGYGLQLTNRPYTLESFSNLQVKAEKYKKLPATIRASILAGLQQPLNKRLAFYARIKKNHPRIFKELHEFCGKPAEGWGEIEKKDDGRTFYTTDIIDAILLLEEEHRQTQTTGKEAN